jgi:hypothetical protein
MKTRDELAEAFAMALAAHQPGALDDADGEDPPEGFLSAAAWLTHHAFRLADAFVAERERRAAKIENRVGHSVDEATLRLDYDQANTIALALGYDASALPLGQAIEKIKELASRAPTEKPHSPDDGCSGCEHYARETMGRSARCAAMEKSFGVAHDPTRPASPHCPKRAALTAAKALRFSDVGDLLNADGKLADTDDDGYAGWALDEEVGVYVRATDRAHAERIVAAMLPVGRGTK